MYTFRGNIFNNAVITYQSRLKDPKIQKTYLGGLIFSTPVIDNNSNIYVGSTDRYFYCIDSNIKWKYQLSPVANSLVDSAAAIHPNGVVIVPGGDGYIHALNLSDGKLVWKTEAIQGVSKEMHNSGVEVNAFEGNIQIDPETKDIYAGCDNGNMYCLNSNGDIKWIYKTDMMIWNCAVIFKEKLYFGSLDKSIYCLNKHTGVLIKKIQTDGEFKSSPVIYSDRLYIGNSNGKARCYNLSLELIFEVDLESDIYSTPVIKDDILIYTTFNGYLFALNANNGQLIYKVDLIDSICSSPLVTQDNIIYISNSIGILFALDFQTGDIISYIQVSEMNLNSSIALHKDYIILAGFDGYVYKIPTNFYLHFKPENIYKNFDNHHFKVIYNNHIVILKLLICNNYIRSHSSGISYYNANNLHYNIIKSSDLKYLILIPKSWNYHTQNHFINIKCSYFNKTKNWFYDRLNYITNHISYNLTFKSIQLPTINIKDNNYIRWDISNLRCLQPIILDTYIPAALNSLGFITYAYDFIQDQEYKKFKMIFIPSIPDIDSFKIIYEEQPFIVDGFIYNNQLFLEANNTITFSFMGGSMEFSQMLCFGSLDDNHNLYADMYAISNCLNVKGNGQNYKFSTDVINQLCDPMMKIHIVSTLSGKNKDFILSSNPNNNIKKYVIKSCYNYTLEFSELGINIIG